MKQVAHRSTVSRSHRSHSASGAPNYPDVAAAVASCWAECRSAAAKREALSETWRDEWLTEWVEQECSPLSERFHCRIVRRLKAEGHPGAVIIGGRHLMQLGALIEYQFRRWPDSRDGSARVIRGWAADLFARRYIGLTIGSSATLTAPMAVSCEAA